ncbi:MAG: response regulator [Bryobacteraceae bacterium]|jgi:two-component system chemotaxis response regulator CheY
MQIMIVDDSKAMRMIIRRALRQAGYGDAEVVEASNGVEGLASIRAANPDLVLCDWNMPGMSGLSVLQNLAKDGCNVRFGFVTSESTAAMREQALGAGALFLISKPFTGESFETVLRPILG